MKSSHSSKLMTLALQVCASATCAHASCGPADSNLEMGIAAFNRASYRIAVSYLRLSLITNNRSALAHYYLACSYDYLHETANAIDEFHSAIRLDPRGRIGGYSSTALAYMSAKNPLEAGRTRERIQAAVSESEHVVTTRAEAAAEAKVAEGEAQVEKLAQEQRLATSHLRTGWREEIDQSYAQQEALQRKVANDDAESRRKYAQNYARYLAST